MTRRGIFWIASYPKSGNTWVRCLIASLQSGGAPVRLGGLGDTVPNSAARAWIEACIDVGSGDMLASELNAMRAQSHREEGARRLCILKVHDRYDPGLFPAEVTLGTIHIVRDPRDVAPSWADHMGVDVDTAIARMADDALTLSRSIDSFRPQAPQRFGSWSGHVRSWLDDAPGPRLLLRYEALLADPLGEAARLSRFMGLSVDADCVARAVDACDFEALRGIEEREGFSERQKGQRRFFRQGRSGAWRGVLQPDQAGRIMGDHGAMMRRLGYGADTLADPVQA
ncbi:sulfotransferase domain-containing protein [Paracidovorax cattleyae]|uniref:Sulfotransferase domain-containing protein n=1 Tax=Paracidovorax cattleyae TaxID=80868 RepID=A0A1H0W6W7_9BURK|nr:sulfotransferase domain-containing protein [Paracidovorax cattleyae]AVS73406.1 aryl sulfotransferase [Paracidovorax cattleyae]SDP86479.1 Sulfotransferase domain-containing protein [Paracidovorax cattleyae]